MKNEMNLLDEFKLTQQITLKNKIIMAPMTRVSASDDFVPTQAMADYYARRAAAGLVVTEGTIIRADGTGHNNVPGIFNHEQIHHWQRVTDAVHHNGGVIFNQLWHVGRVSHPCFLHGNLPLSASETEMTGNLTRSTLTYGKSRAATKDEITSVINAYADAANNAMKAGFDGVEIHGANGYLIDQFLHYDTNHREDDYGGTPQNMARFALEIVKACGETIGYQRVGLRLSPGGYLNQLKGDMRDKAVFHYLLSELNKLRLAYLHTGTFNDALTYPELDDQTMSHFMRQHYSGILIGCGSYAIETAEQAINESRFNLIALGRPFIANPDLIQRITHRQALNTYDVSMLKSLY